jgi:hypothetical protein
LLLLAVALLRLVVAPCIWPAGAARGSVGDFLSTSERDRPGLAAGAAEAIALLDAD